MDGKMRREQANGEVGGKKKQEKEEREGGGGIGKRRRWWRRWKEKVEISVET